jgi:phytoene synthase
MRNCEAQGTMATKQPRDENFPVASLVLAPPQRKAVLAFYRFVRMADDIADDPHLAGEEKIARLVEAEAALLTRDPGVPSADAVRNVEEVHGVGLDEARTLLFAFRQDAVKTRYADWAELIDYCRRSAVPVGRFLLRLHRESDAAYGPADALCIALQILNHLQDLAPDRERLGRVYLPTSWLERAGGEAAFFAAASTGARRAVLDAALDRADDLIAMARALPERLVNPRLRAQATATVALAEALSRRLRDADPVLTRVEIGKADVARAFMRGLAAAPRRDHGCDERVTRAMVRRSGSSFRLGMQSLSHERRRAIHAVYGFCRAVDDIADGRAPAAEKLRFLGEWRAEIERLHDHPLTPVGRELAWAARRFALPLEECHALIDGMVTDSADRVRLADDDALDAYGRRVAGSVGLLSIRVFGAPEARDFALGLGRTLQVVNILRDVDEDATLDRVYVPLSRLSKLGIEDAPAPVLVTDPRFARACETLAEEAQEGFAAADRALDRLDRTTLKPAILMMEGYRRIFDRLLARGWGERQGRLRLSMADRLQLLTLAMRPA